MRRWELELALVQSQFPLRPNPRASLSSDSALSQPYLPAGKPQPPDSRWSPGTNSEFVPFSCLTVGHRDLKKHRTLTKTESRVHEELEAKAGPPARRWSCWPRFIG